MAKFYGEIGYVRTEKTAPGKWTKVAAERVYSGEFNRISKRWQRGTKVNDDLSIQAEVSIVADPFLYDHLHEIRYVRINGVPWGVASIEPQHPRLVLALGGVYNGPVAKPESSDTGNEETGTSGETGNSSGI